MDRLDNEGRGGGSLPSEGGASHGFDNESPRVSFDRSCRVCCCCSRRRDRCRSGGSGSRQRAARAALLGTELPVLDAERLSVMLTKGVWQRYRKRCSWYYDRGLVQPAAALMRWLLRRWLVSGLVFVVSAVLAAGMMLVKIRSQLYEIDPAKIPANLPVAGGDITEAEAAARRELFIEFGARDRWRGEQWERLLDIASDPELGGARSSALYSFTFQALDAQRPPKPVRDAFLQYSMDVVSDPQAPPALVVGAVRLLGHALGPDHPDTIRAYQEALVSASQRAPQDRELIEQHLPLSITSARQNWKGGF